MLKLNFIIKLTIPVLAAICCLSAAVFAQSEPKILADTNYEIILQVLVSSNNTGIKTPPPASLAGPVRRLKELYPNSNYYLSSTYLQRIANTGDFEVKGISSASNQTPDSYAPSFTEWGVGQLSSGPDARGANVIQLKNFRFKQKISVKIGGLKGEDGKFPTVGSYESIGLSMQKINLAENIPTILGNFSGSTSDDAIFLIVTVKPVQN